MQQPPSINAFPQETIDFIHKIIADALMRASKNNNQNPKVKSGS